VLAVACDHRVLAAGDSYRADALSRRSRREPGSASPPATAPRVTACTTGAFIRLDDRAPSPGGHAGQHWLLVRRNRRTVEERFQTGKGLVGLDQHQVRRWRSWYRWVTLAMLAHAFLVVAAVTQHARHPPPSGRIALTCNEVQHLFAALVAVPVADPGHRLRWWWWRRRQQHRARACHYRRRASQP
jgi:hypothetical protein